MELKIINCTPHEVSLSHNRLSAFGVIGTENVPGVFSTNGGGHNRLSAFGVIGTRVFEIVRKADNVGHNRLSAFGVIGTRT